jgi:hypothetical protein
VSDKGAQLTLFSAVLDPGKGTEDERGETCLSVKTASMSSAVQLCRLRPGKDEQCNLVAYKFGVDDMPCEFSVEESEGAVAVHLVASLETPCSNATLEKLTAQWNTSQGVKTSAKKKAPAKKRKRIEAAPIVAEPVGPSLTASQEKRKKRLKLKKKGKEDLKRKLDKENAVVEEELAAPIRAKREAGEKQWLAELVDAIQTYGGVAEMTVLGSDVKKPKGIPKKIKLAYFMHQHKDIFQINEGLKKKDKVVTVQLRGKDTKPTQSNQTQENEEDEEEEE